MGKIVTRNQPCLDPSCGSSDARQIYEDGSSFCFSCNKSFNQHNIVDQEFVEEAPFKKSSITLEMISDFQSRGFRERLIKKSTAEFYGVKVSYDTDGEIAAHYYPYDGGKAYKCRSLPKEFTWVGKSISLFGREKFEGGGRRLIIVEGEIDAMVMQQVSYDKYQRYYPVVALSSASIVEKTLLASREWIRSFQEVVLCFDNDEAGEKATKIAVKIVGYDKAKIAKLPEKDPDLVNQIHGGERLLQCIFNAEKFVPAGIIGKDALWDALKSYNDIPSVPYPAELEGINGKLKGMRTGEITLFVSGTGSGKSTILRSIMKHILTTTEDKIGIISLEESPAETARKLAGMAISRNPSEEEIPLEELKVGFDIIFGDDRVVLLDHQGSINDSRIVDQLEYMCLSGCKYLFIDHITILVSEGVENLTGLEAQDKMMNELLRLVKRHPVWIGLVSHLRKAAVGGKSFEEGKMATLDDIRGSGAIKQVSFDIVAFARNLVAETEAARNAIKMCVLKARYTGLTGMVRGAIYDRATGLLKALESDPDEEDFTSI